MILAKAPMRVSFFGGGSDIPTHYKKYGGATISTAINKYVYVAVGYTPHIHIKISYMKQELVTDVNEIKNEIVRETLKYFNVYSNIEINTWAEIPTMGTGLSGSSAFTCALVRALAHYKNITLSDYDVANIACDIEINKCGWNIGKQDQYACAFGGHNYIEYSEDDYITVTKLPHNNITSNCILIPTMIQRHASEILNKVDFKNKSAIINDIANIAREYKDIPVSAKSYAEAIERSWNLKKQMDDGITNDEIDTLVQRAYDSGAIACKLLGAGGGGYLLALVDSKNNKDDIFREFQERICLKIKTAEEGARVVYFD
jgi:D-glycero-alpha-D-manno-heptose-7-phosphate kinase